MDRSLNHSFVLSLRLEMWLQQALKYLWLAVTIFHGSFLILQVPGASVIWAVIGALQIGLKFGRFSSGANDSWLKIPDSLAISLALVAVSAHIKEYDEDNNGPFQLFFLKRFTFWVLICMNATESSHVLIPMLWAVRPWYALSVIVILANEQYRG